ncbi:hypothetical protein [Oricola sp.]|uniref:hypothetical protein n=1 Tax=Oricola sp. TaxID=1979950 RepID=UPI0025FBC102|nr:hypothetical protein [Oricola sp.]MCI5076787.1 hypothetical protein [Oricola sp.]
MSNVQAHRVTRFGAILALLTLASCQSTDLGGMLTTKPTGKPGDEEISGADLRAYCPRVQLREGTAILRTYAKGHDGEADQIIYQATITDVTRTCKYEGGLLYMQVVAAGRVVEGPKGKSGALELPIRVAVRQGETLPYSQLGKLQVAVAPNAGATQFIFKDQQVSVPAPSSQNLQVFVGFDEGPYGTP